MADGNSQSRVPLGEVTKDEELWFDDGNVVLIAESTAFRLYKGLLSATSPVFKDLFSLAGSEDEERMEGCPVVRVHDLVTQLRHFLRMLYMPGFAMLPATYRPSFSTLSAIIRIGHKYQTDSAVNAATSHLEAFFSGFPKTATNMMQDRPNLPAARTLADVWRHHQAVCRMNMSVEDAIEALNLARLFDLPQVVPLALFLCCAGDPLHLKNGVRREDGTVAQLSDDDFVRCIRAFPLLNDALHQVVQETLHSYSRPVETFSGCQCRGVVKEMLVALESERPQGVVADLHVRFGLWKNSQNAWKEREETLCKTCRAQLVIDAINAYISVWFTLCTQLSEL